ncbi:prepilin-type N-terminal cleavage/methylation domain-containing protein [Acinetobacter sp. 187]|uniref:pilus assembly FimT family protein n=1 Tax=Acinetobacter lanii TaxID=2715163 RepID=UPI001407F9CF|nr:prepilin-type N-terminal cleavage/methylation domain-containing protein [Acinetobacter lanii]NHC02900.1 prepilin-type N-terminal cleavage/methylation domain-containing protein [Acinetobacter lanii]
MKVVNRGFTLIELMITIAILAILSAIAVPNFRITINSYQLNSHYKSLITVLGSARNQALTLKKEVIVQLNSDAPNTPTQLNWKAGGSNNLKESLTLVSITFTPVGTIKNYDTSTSILSVCNTYLKKTKRLQISRVGSLTFLPEGSCT